MATGFAGVLSGWEQWFPHAQPSHGKAKPGRRQGCVSGYFQAESGMWERMFLHMPPDPMGVLLPPGWAFSLLLMQGSLHSWDAAQERELPQVPSCAQSWEAAGMHLARAPWLQ